MKNLIKKILKESTEPEIKVGTILYCLDNVIMDDNQDLAAKKGKGYEIVRVIGDEFYIIDELGDNHWFDLKRSDDSYYGNWFSLLPEDIRDRDLFKDLYESENKTDYDFLNDKSAIGLEFYHPEEFDKNGIVYKIISISDDGKHFLVGWSKPKMGTTYLGIDSFIERIERGFYVIKSDFNTADVFDSLNESEEDLGWAQDVVKNNPMNEFPLRLIFDPPIKTLSKYNKLVRNLVKTYPNLTWIDGNSLFSWNPFKNGRPRITTILIQKYSNGNLQMAYGESEPDFSRNDNLVNGSVFLNESNFLNKMKSHITGKLPKRFSIFITSMEDLNMILNYFEADGNYEWVEERKKPTDVSYKIKKDIIDRYLLINNHGVNNVNMLSYWKPHRFRILSGRIDFGVRYNSTTFVKKFIKPVDTNKLFDKLYESEGDELEWAKDVVNSENIDSKVTIDNVRVGEKVTKGPNWPSYYDSQTKRAVYGNIISPENFLNEMYEGEDVDEVNFPLFRLGDRWWCVVEWVDKAGKVTHRNAYEVGPETYNLNYYTD